MSGSVKVHIGKYGSATPPVCGGIRSRTGGISLGAEEFARSPAYERCARCEKKLPTYLRMAAKKATDPRRRRPRSPR